MKFINCPKALCLLCPLPLPSQWLSAPFFLTSWLECPNVGPITITAPFLLHLVVKCFSILLRKYLSPFEGSKSTAHSAHSWSRASVWRKCPVQGWDLGENLSATYRVSPLPLTWGVSCLWLGNSSSVISEDIWIKSLSFYYGSLWWGEVAEASVPTHTQPFRLIYLNLPKFSILSKKSIPSL